MAIAKSREITRRNNSDETIGRCWSDDRYAPPSSEMLLRCKSINNLARSSVREHHRRRLCSDGDDDARSESDDRYAPPSSEILLRFSEMLEIRIENTPVD